MKRIKFILLFIIFFLPFNVLAITLPKLNSNNIIVYDDANKEILYEKNASEVVNIASLTKIMTTIVAIENINDLNETVEITNSMLQEVPWDASIAGLKEGDVVTYRDLLYATMLPSGADAATALAHSISGNTNSFVHLMNQKAKVLDLNDTHFVNVTGLDADGHYSSANDVLKYLLYALQNDPNYFKYAIKELLNQQRVERYLSVGLKTDREIRDINSAIFEGKEYNSPNAASIDEVAKDSELIRRGKKVYPCGRYVGEILPRDGHVGIVFDPSVGRICHDEPTIANDRQRLQDEKMRMKNAQMLEAQRKYERLQQEYRNMQSPINYQDQPNDDGR